MFLSRFFQDLDFNALSKCVKYQNGYTENSRTIQVVSFIESSKLKESLQIEQLLCNSNHVVL